MGRRRRGRSIIHLISTYDSLGVAWSRSPKRRKEISVLFFEQEQEPRIVKTRHVLGWTNLITNPPTPSRRNVIMEEETRKDTWLDIARLSISISLFLCLCDRVWEGSLKILVRWSRVDETARNILPRARSAYAISIITLHEDGMLTRPCSSILGQSFINDGNV